MKLKHKLARILAPFMIASAASIAYFPGLGGGFAFDDIGLVESDTFYSSPATRLSDCWHRTYWREGMSIGQYRPITLTSFLLNSRITGMFSPGFRAVNLLLHITVSLMILKLANKLRMGFLASFLAAMLFSVHPFISEAVIPATGRAELLSLAFVLAGLITHIQLQTSIPKGKSREPVSKLSVNRVGSAGAADGAAKWLLHAINCLCPHRRGLASKITGRTATGSFEIASRTFRKAAQAILPPACLFLAFASKESGIVLLPLCIMYDCMLNKQNKQKLSMNIINKRAMQLAPVYASFILVIAISFYMRTSLADSTLPDPGAKQWIDNPLIGEPLSVRIITATKVQGIALTKFFWPAKLSHDYSYAQITPVANFADPYALFALFMFSAVPASLFAMLPRQRARIAFLYLAYVLSILPAGNFIMCTGTIFGERTFYSPVAWLCCIAAIAVLRVSQKLHAATFIPVAVFAVAVAAAIPRVWVRCADWDSQDSIAAKGVKTAPHSVKTWNNLAVSLANADMLEEAVLACDKALEIYPEYVSAITNRAYYHTALKKFDLAEADFRHLISLGSQDPDIYNTLGGILATNSRRAEARNMWKRSLEIKPGQNKITKALRLIRQETGE
ncbi:MAG: DUF1736 domain-containing protein [Victivallales bacterium]|nr:DUF1736 domain-containing protein [Victivallales bacterium]